MKLYELEKQIDELLEEVYANDGELTIEIEKKLENLEIQKEDKFQNWAGFIMQLKSDIEQVKNEENRLKVKRQQLENSMNRSKEYLLLKMSESNISKLKGMFNINISKRKKYEYLEDEVSDDFFKIEKKLNKVALKNAWKKDNSIKGIIEYEADSITIK